MTKQNAVTSDSPGTNPYDIGFWQGVSGVELKGHHTPEFIAGYINGSQNYQSNRGYVDGNNRLPNSSTDMNYTQGYDNAAVQDRELFGDKVVVDPNS